MRMVHCLAFSGPAEYGGVRRGERPVGTSRSGIAIMCPYRRASQKEVGR